MIYLKNIYTHQSVLMAVPDHFNIGDQAIALREMQILNQLRINSFNVIRLQYGEGKAKLAKLIPADYLILYHGGGNLGSLWKDEENQFRKILINQRKQKIIVFPQTVFFDMDRKTDIQYFQESKEIYSSHPNLTIFVREQFSLEFMREYMPEVQVILVPDVVLTYKPPLSKRKRNGTLLCLRNDKERTITQNEYNFIL